MLHHSNLQQFNLFLRWINHHPTVSDQISYGNLTFRSTFFSFLGFSPPPAIVVQPVVTFLGHKPSTTQCMKCRQQVITTVRYEISGMTWLVAFLICVFGGFIGCCLIPFCVPGCQDAVHTCPSCHTTLGRKHPF